VQELLRHDLVAGPIQDRVPATGTAVGKAAGHDASPQAAAA
jgi:hypothetical protein